MYYLVAVSLVLIVAISTECTAVVDDVEPVRETCEEKTNGVYAIRDCFKYMQCASGVKYVLSCPRYFIFDPETSSCLSNASTTTETFCHVRENGNYVNPWDCRQYIRCIFGWSDIHDCEDGLFYEPTNDTCEITTAGGIPCQGVVDQNNETNSNVTETDFTNSTTNRSVSTNNATTNNVSQSDLITAGELKSKLENGNVQLIDVRMQWELKVEGRIAHSVNIPLNEIENTFKLEAHEFKLKYGIEKPLYDDCNLVFHCKSGVRGQYALDIAKRLGYTCARNLDGGFDVWKSLYT